MAYCGRRTPPGVLVEGFVVTGLLLGGMVLAMAQGWIDEFDGSALAERWHWQAPAGGECAVRDGAVVLSAPEHKGGLSLWRGVFDAPMLLTALPDQDWAVEATLAVPDFAPDADAHVGIVIGASSEGCRYAWIWGPLFSASNWRMSRPELWLERTGEPRILTAPIDGKTLELRIERRGEWLHFLRRAGDAWQEVGNSLIWFAPRQAGLVVKTWGAGRAQSLRVERFRLEPLTPEPAPLTASVRIDAGKKLNEINPLIYGQFIEHLGRCIYGGIWAEMLTNRKFTGAAAPSGVVESWAPFGSEAAWQPEDIDYYVGGQAQRIASEGDTEHGIAQGGLAILPKRYAGRVVARADGPKQIRVSLRAGGKILAEQTLTGLTGKWSKLPFTLDVGEGAPAADFVISFAGKGTLWIGAVSLMPGDNEEGMRRDVLDAIRDMKAPIVRWPGGNFVSGYHWKDGIGDPDKRPPRWDRAWNAWEWNDFGTDEFMAFCRLVGTEPYICANAGEADEREAAEWMAYCKQKGYHVRYWGIGNEMYGGWQLGHLEATPYALKANLFADAMHKVQPDARLIVNGVDGGGWGDWNAKVAHINGGHSDLLSVHYYQGYDRADAPEYIYTVVAGSPAHIEAMLRESNDIVVRNKPAGRELPIAFDEWNVWEPFQDTSQGLESFYALRDGVFAAGVFHALQRCGGFVEMANLAQTVNVLGILRTNQTQVAKSPIYWAFWMYARGTGKWRVGCEVAAPLGTVPVGGKAPVVDASATLSEDGKALFVGLINRHPQADVAVELDLGGFGAGPQVSMMRLAGRSFLDTNTFEEPDKVKPSEETLSLEGAKRLVLPRHSVTVLRFERPQ
jgi:alpha-N-arabinofuranosidase